MNKERLTVLANALRADAANPQGMKFNLNLWLEAEDDRPALDCGTAGCAMGLAMLIPEFNRLGLVPMVAGTLLPTFKVTGELADKLIEQDNKLRGSYDSETQEFEGFAAAAVFFDIPYMVATALFDPGRYHVTKTVGSVGEITVAEKIEAHMRGEDVTEYSGPWMNSDFSNPAWREYNGD